MEKVAPEDNHFGKIKKWNRKKLESFTITT